MQRACGVRGVIPSTSIFSSFQCAMSENYFAVENFISVLGEGPYRRNEDREVFYNHSRDGI